MSMQSALLGMIGMALVIFMCRAVPFIFFSRGLDSPFRRGFISFVERIVPPVAMTALALDALIPVVRSDLGGSLPSLIAALFTALIHLWKRNALLSIGGGTVLYMVLEKILP